jgi:hypothetical protein
MVPSSRAGERSSAMLRALFRKPLFHKEEVSAFFLNLLITAEFRRFHLFLVSPPIFFLYFRIRAGGLGKTKERETNNALSTFPNSNSTHPKL